jgi:hypothetical protein
MSPMRAFRRVRNAQSDSERRWIHLLLAQEPERKDYTRQYARLYRKRIEAREGFRMQDGNIADSRRVDLILLFSFTPLSPSPFPRLLAPPPNCSTSRPSAGSGKLEAREEGEETGEGERGEEQGGGSRGSTSQPCAPPCGSGGLRRIFLPIFRRGPHRADLTAPGMPFPSGSRKGHTFHLELVDLVSSPTAHGNCQGGPFFSGSGESPRGRECLQQSRADEYSGGRQSA